MYLCAGIAAYLFGFTKCPPRPNKCAAIALAKRPFVPGRKEGERNRKRETSCKVRLAVSRNATALVEP